MSELATVDTDDRPDWVPSAIWEDLKRKMVLIKMRVCKDSIEQVEVGFGLPPGKLRNFLRLRRWRPQLEEVRKRTEELSGLAGEMATEALVEKLSRPEVVDKLSARDLSIIGKQQSENALNLSNGQVGASQTNITFNDLKMMVAGSIEKPTLDV